MPIAIQCPSCQKPYSLPETLQKKKVRCLDCKREFTVEPPADVPVVEAVPEDAPEASHARGLQQTPGRMPSPPKMAKQRPERDREPGPERRPQSAGGGVLVPLLMAGVVLFSSAVVVGLSAVATRSLLPAPGDLAGNFPNPNGNQGNNGWPRPPIENPPPPVDNLPPIENPPVEPPRKDPEPRLRPAEATRNIRLPEPAEGAGLVGAQERVVPGIAVRYVPIKPLPCLAWSADAKSFYAVEAGGLLRRVSLDNFQETRRLALGHATTSMSMSAEGLLVLLRDLKEVWLIDPDSLRVKKRAAVDGTVSVVSSLALSVAFVEGTNGYLAAVDLRTTQAREYNSRDFGSVGFAKAAVTPDGKYLFGQGFERLHRFKIDGTKLVLEESGQRIAQNGQATCVSNEYVSLPSGGGNYGDAKGHPPISRYSTYVYRVGNLSTPAFVVDSGAYPRNMGFDPRARLVYAQGGTTELMPYSEAGQKQAEYRLDGSGWVLQYLVHPDGKKLLVLTNNTNLFWVDLQGGDRPNPPAGEPVISDPRREFAGPKQTVNGASVTAVTLSAKTTVPALLWADDGKSFYALDANGTLRRVALDNFKETMRSEREGRSTWLARSAEGLVVTVPGRQEIAIVDPESFKLKRTIPAPLVSKVLSAPSLSVGFGLSASRPGAEELTAFDLKKGEAIGRVKTDRGRGNFTLAAITDDGKYLIGMEGAALARYRIEGTELKYEESGNPLAAGRVDHIQASPDGKFVCLPTGGGNAQDLPGHPKGKPYSTWVYPITDLKKPAALVPSGAYPMTVGFDPKAELIYAQNAETPLIVYDYAGNEKGKYAFGGRGSDVKQFLPHPDGRKLLLFTSTGLAWVELPEK